MAGGEANLWDFYIIQTILAFLCPPLLYMFPLLIEYWLLGLPSQVSESGVFWVGIKMSVEDKVLDFGQGKHHQRGEENLVENKVTTHVNERVACVA